MDENSSRNGVDESNCSRNDVEDIPIPVSSSPENKKQVNVLDVKGDPPLDGETHGEVNMEVSVMAEDVIRAGGFGARDDISSFLPVASDSTDFEATIRDARDYEEPQGEICRPGLGRTEAMGRN